jgi:hypothetical protein
MDFQITFLNDLDDEFEDLEAEFIEAHSWLNAVQISELKALQKNKFLSGIERLK